MKYLSKFDAEGKRISSYPLDVLMTAETIESMKSEGFIEISEEDWNRYIGNYGMGKNGTGYIRGKDGKPVDAPAYVPTKEEKAAQLYAELQSDLSQINQELYDAVADGDTDLATDLRQEKKERLAQYQSDLAELED